MDTIKNETNHGIGFCRKQSLSIERGSGSYVWDEQGNRYLDFTSGWGVTCLGHCHPVITEAIADQSGRLLQNPNSGFTYSPARSRLMELMAGILPAGLTRTFFVNSGAEANDAAIKLARKLTGRDLIISTRESFHGRTFGTLSVSSGESQVRRFRTGESGTLFVPFGDLDAIASIIGERVAAVIVEPVQGEGGVRIPAADYLPEISRLCRKHGSYLIVDEIQTGFGRTGRLFAIQHAPRPVEADFLTLGKGLAGGFPFAGLAVSDRVAHSIEIGDHGGTYCGNPLGCAVAYAVVRHLVDNDVSGRAASSGRLLFEGLVDIADRHPGMIREARGIGLLTALDFRDEEMAWVLTAACQDRGLLVTPTRSGIVRLIPDLLVGRVELNAALEIVDRALRSLAPRVAAAS